MFNPSVSQLINQNINQLKHLLEFSAFQNNYPKALDFIIKLIHLDQQNKQSYLRKKVEILCQLKYYQQVVKCVEQLWQINQNYMLDIQLHNFIIKANLQIGHTRKADQIIHSAINCNPALKHFIELRDTVAKIQNKQPYRLPNQQQQILANMKEWLYKAGSTYDKVKIINQSKDYRGGIATKSISKDQIIVFIPKSQLITLQEAKLLSISKQLMSCQCQLISPKHCLLSIYLLQLRQKREKYLPYIQILPKDHSCFPINYTKQQLQQLLGSPFLLQIRQKVIDLKKDYDTISFVSQQFRHKYTFKQFNWARMMVGSRVFGVNIQHHKTQILAPFADMLNHKVPKQTLWNYSEQKQGFFIQSLKQINVGQEIFDSYGKKCNSRFLLSYGFVMENNDRNQICIKVEITETDFLLEKKKQMVKIEKQLLLVRIFRINKFMEENSFMELMGFLRFKNIQKLQTLILLQKISNVCVNYQPYKPVRTPPITVQLQIKAWKDLQQLCKQCLSNYPTSIQQDKILLSHNDLSYNIRNIIILRLGQKQLYQNYIRTSQNAIRLLQKGYVMARDEALSQPDVDYCKYVSKILKLMPHQKNNILEMETKYDMAKSQTLNQQQESDASNDNYQNQDL